MVVERLRESGRSPTPGTPDRAGATRTSASARRSRRPRRPSRRPTRTPAAAASRSSSAQPAAAIARSRSRLRERARPACSTTATSAGSRGTCAPPLTSGSARLRTKSILKRNSGSSSCVCARTSPAGVVDAGTGAPRTGSRAAPSGRSGPTRTVGGIAARRARCDRRPIPPTAPDRLGGLRGRTRRRGRGAGTGGRGPRR